MSKEEKPIEEAPKEKIYSYKKMNKKLVWKQHTFKESEMTEEDFLHFYKELAAAYNKAPFGVKMCFMNEAGPKMQEHLVKDSTKTAMAAGIALDSGASDLSIVN